MKKGREFMQTEEYREKMKAIALKRNYGKWMIGKKMPLKTREALLKANTNREVNIETRKKISESNKGTSRLKSDSHPSWKGDEVGYAALHSWVTRNMGKPQECVYCGKTRIEGVIDWASISHKAKRDLNDFISLCRSCHRNYDYQNNKINLLEA